MHSIELVAAYGDDTVDLVRTIEKKLASYLSTRKYGDSYVECSDFRMVPKSNIGLFVVKFPNAKPVAVAGIDMMTGDYILKTDKKIPIYELDGLDMSRLINAAETEWANAPQKKREAGEITELTIRF